MELSQKLKVLRKKKGLSQFELAEVLCVSRQAITGWEAGTSSPSTENLQSLSRLYNVPLEMLLDDTVTAEPELEKIPVAELHEETGELEQEKGKDGRRYKLLTVIIIFGFLLVLLAVSAQSYRGINQDKSEALTFNEMESEIIDTTEETTEVSLVGID